MGSVKWPEAPNGINSNTPPPSPSPLPLTKTLSDCAKDPDERANRVIMERALHLGMRGNSASGNLARYYAICIPGDFQLSMVVRTCQVFMIIAEVLHRHARFILKPWIAKNKTPKSHRGQ